MEKERKTIKCSYVVLVIILFAALAFVTDYAIIERKMNKCDCPKCEITTNNEEKNIVSYNYEDVAGYYTVNYSFNSEKTDSTDASVFLHIYSDGTYSYRYSFHAPYGTVGNYIIKDNTIIMNDIARTGSGTDFTPISSSEISNSKRSLIINDDGSLTDSSAPMSEITGIYSIKLEKNDEDPLGDKNEFRMFVNYSNIDEY